jgi:hypothetical protein
MHLEEAMRQETERLEREIENIDLQMEKLHNKILDLIAIRKKREHDLRALKNSFAQTEADETLMEILKGKQKVGI